MDELLVSAAMGRKGDDSMLLQTCRDMVGDIASPDAMARLVDHSHSGLQIRFEEQ